MCFSFQTQTFISSSQGLYVYSDFWLSDWTKDEDTVRKGNLQRTAFIEAAFNTSVHSTSNSSYSNVSSSIDWLPTTGFDAAYTSRERLYIYVSILAAIVVGALARGVVTMFVTVNAAAKLHNRMYDSVSNAPILFFDTNPSGRILNRFSKVGGTDLPRLIRVLMVDFVAEVQECIYQQSGRPP